MQTAKLLPSSDSQISPAKISNMLKCLFHGFSIISSDFCKSTNFDTHNKDALKSISCIWKSSMSIHSNADKSKSSLLPGLRKENNEPEMLKS